LRAKVRVETEKWRAVKGEIWAGPVKMGSVLILGLIILVPSTPMLTIFLLHPGPSECITNLFIILRPTFAAMEQPGDLTVDTKAILGLQLPTDPRWVNLAEKSLEEVLTDHAYCEQKAATFCISLIQRYNEKERLVMELSPIVTEEWGHFRLVLAELQKRGLKLGRQRKDEYVNALNEFSQKGGSEEGRLLDQLLMMAMIEARSCERFKRLSEGLNDGYLRKFYRRFMESEAGHYTLFIELAETYIDKEKVRKRWNQWLDHETKIMKTLEVRGDRMH
jgi:tRNA 2-(methylsulfanyl)-N6-isopentenyladenosine37 hydroxylase